MKSDTCLLFTDRRLYHAQDWLLHFPSLLAIVCALLFLLVKRNRGGSPQKNWYARHSQNVLSLFAFAQLVIYFDSMPILMGNPRFVFGHREIYVLNQLAQLLLSVAVNFIIFQQVEITRKELKIEEHGYFWALIQFLAFVQLVFLCLFSYHSL